MVNRDYVRIDEPLMDLERGEAQILLGDRKLSPNARSLVGVIAATCLIVLVCTIGISESTSAPTHTDTTNNVKVIQASTTRNSVVNPRTHRPTRFTLTKPVMPARGVEPRTQTPAHAVVAPDEPVTYTGAWLLSQIRDNIPFLPNRMKLKLWSFNLRTEFQDEADGEDAWPHRRESVVDMLNRHRPSIVSTQESTGAMLQYITEHTAMQSFGISRSDDTVDEHVAILYDGSHLRPVDGDTLWLSQTPHTQSIGWDAMYPRIATWAEFEHVNRPGAPHVIVINTHFDHEGLEARGQSAVLINQLAQELSDRHPDVNIVLTGDFNSIKEHNNVYETLTAGEGMFEDAWVTADDTVQPPIRSSIHKFQGLAFTADQGDGTVDLMGGDEEADTHRGSGGFIDWVLIHRPSPGTARANVATLVIDSRSDTDSKFPSDHFPIEVEFVMEM